MFIRSRRGGQSATQGAMWACHKAWQEITKGSWDTAVYMARAALAADPKLADAYRMLGYAYMRAGDHARARAAFTEGGHLAPADPMFPAYLGELELGVGRYAEAEAAYRRALELQLDEAPWLLNLAHAVGAQHRDEESATLLEKAHELAPNEVRVLATLGAVRLRQGDLERASAALRDAVQVDPSFAGAHYYAAVCLKRAERWAEALEEAHRAAELDPNDAEYLRLLTQIESIIQKGKQDSSG